MVVRMRHTRAHTGNRRSHHALAQAVLSLCKDCGSPKAPHKVCSVCGKYKGIQVLNLKSKLEKKVKKEKASKSR